MATVVLQYAGQAAGAFLGGPIGGIIGRAVGAVAGNFIDQALFGGGARKIEGPRLNDLRVMSSSEGAPVPRLWGRMRVAGQVIWATSIEEVSTTRTEKSSAKGSASGGTKVTEYEYFANFAVALCEGEVDRIGRVWADGKEIDVSELTFRLHPGSETQEPDSLVVAKEGADEAPAYRGIAYVVFERMPVSAFGNRIPQLSFEVHRSVGGAEDHVRAINIIPGSTEFGYDTELITRDAGAGVTDPENTHASALRSDWTVSIDDLTATCRNVSAASLVVAWFGTDLRCGIAEVKPGVESASKITDPVSWSVGGITRSAAHQVSLVEESPAYGGTPSDASVIHAIQDLRARGLEAMFYPFILMDVPAGNGLADPYGGSEQAVYPWRGRITCDPAPGLPGSPDRTALCAAQVQSFIGTAQVADFTVNGTAVTYTGPAEWSYRRMVLHYAHLCAAAGGVDAFLISSELRGLTTLRGMGNNFPFVDALVTLAAEVKVILPAAKVSYAADWSEYFGHQPGDGSGDVFFHLDPLWSSPHVDFIGIDNYMPLSDWRDGDAHADRLAGFASIHDADYLKSNIAGGEGHDWYYASGSDRLDQIRSPISDGAYGKPWVFRYKDIRSWWENPHHDRPSGVENATATGWVPQSKPVWFTEAGCPAIDKGTNQPNAFVDEKSSESLLAYFSDGQRDDLIQNRFIQAIDGYWREAGPHNPVSPLYGGPMVDAGHIFLWAWDARPYPFFPARTDTWSDGVNYARGHWLNGRIGAVPLGRLILSVCADYGFADVDVEAIEGLVDGFVIDRGMSARDAMEGLLSAFGIDALESGGKLKFRMRSKSAIRSVSTDNLVETDAAASLLSVTRSQETELPSAVKLAYIESGLDYRRAAVESHRLSGSSTRDIFVELPCAIEQAPAQMRADMALQESWASRDRIELGLGNGWAELEVGDVLDLQMPSGIRRFRLDEITDGNHRKLRGKSFQATVYDLPEAPSRTLSAATAIIHGKPDMAIMDLPIATSIAEAHAPWFAASARPWPGTLDVHRRIGTNSFLFNRLIESQATKGRLLDTMPAGPLLVFDRATSFTIQLQNGALSSVSEAEVLDGQNIAAVGDATNGWEIIQFAMAELVGANTYRLSKLLRGQSGSEIEMLPSRGAGSVFVLLNGAVVQPQLVLADARLALTWRFGPAQYDINRAHISIAHKGRMLGLRPHAPCQLRAVRDGGDVVFNWTRRTRIDGDSWDLEEVPLGEDGEAYRIDIMDGAVVRRTALVTTSSYRYLAASIAADFAIPPTEYSLRVAQISATYGRGANLVRTIHV